ncbi:MAG: glycoside hydrolase family 2 protein [Ruminococcaceae bacterium]|nr:glycoside hydrolase family 2 protein [Oscillospiraceae bacterium]
MRIELNDGWEFTPKYNDELGAPIYKVGDTTEVRIPHSVKITPFNYFNNQDYEMVSGYRKVISLPREWEGKRLILTFDAVAHSAEVRINGSYVTEHHCGYTAFRCEITDLVTFGRENIISVKCDSRESLNIPPFGNLIDYLTYGGIYREVHLDVYDRMFIKDIFVTGDKDGNVKAAVNLDGEDPNAKVKYLVRDLGTDEAVNQGFFEEGAAEFTINNVKPWDIDSPNLYAIECSLYIGDVKTDTKKVTFGCRTAEFKADGFYLNGKKLMLKGLNRHQSYPYAGYAMPENIQRLDAKILKKELGVNVVRTSHYPQSHHFIDECDKEGLLVVTEMPGWQNIGDEKWKEQAVKNCREMVEQYRNHPSIIVWGVRINESADDDGFYKKTNKVAHECDPTRQTTGIRCIEKSSLLEDVYAFNDFSHSGYNAGVKPKSRVTPDMEKGYFISEFNGHMFPAKVYDPEENRLEQALRHSNVLDAAAGEEGIAGAIGWCFADYNTHKEFGSGDKLCHHGVCDMFRNPKLAAYVYAASREGDPFVTVSSSMDPGEHAAEDRGKIYIFTNCDSVKMYKDDIFIKEYKHNTDIYQNLKNAPILIDDYIGGRLEKEEKYDPKQAELIKYALNFMASGDGKMPFGKKLKLGFAMNRLNLSADDMTSLYRKYVGDRGGKTPVYRFEGIKDGETVVTVTKTAATELKLDCTASASSLKEGATYDACEVRVRVTDEYGNVMPFYNTPAKVTCKGPVELLGGGSTGSSCECDIFGGMGGFYVRTVKDGWGKAEIKVTLPGRDVTQVIPIEVLEQI